MAGVRHLVSTGNGPRGPVAKPAGAIRFLREQDGVPERALKLRLSALFRRDARIARAYLVRTDPKQGTGPVVLGLQASSADEQLLLEIGTVFASVFGDDEHLDILFLSSEQEVRCAFVCPAFFAQ
jgi:hypothetical protein